MGIRQQYIAQLPALTLVYLLRTTELRNFMRSNLFDENNPGRKEQTLPNPEIPEAILQFVSSFHSKIDFKLRLTHSKPLA